MVMNTVGVVTFCCAIRTFAYVMWLLFQCHYPTQSLLAYSGFSQFLLYSESVALSRLLGVAQFGGSSEAPISARHH